MWIFVFVVGLYILANSIMNRWIFIEQLNSFLDIQNLLKEISILKNRLLGTQNKILYEEIYYDTNTKKLHADVFVECNEEYPEEGFKYLRIHDI